MMDKLVIVRKATIKDVNDIVKLTHDYDLYEYKLNKEDRPESIVDLRKYIIKEVNDKSGDNGCFILDNGKIVGFIDFSISKKFGDKIGRINNLFISEKFRGRGYGDLLVKKLLSYFKKSGCKKVMSFVKMSNKKAKSFWVNQKFDLRHVDGYTITRSLL